MQSQPFFPASEADTGGQAPIVRDGGVQNLRSLQSSQLNRQIPSLVAGENETRGPMLRTTVHGCLYAGCSLRV